MNDYETRSADDFVQLGYLKRHFKGINGFIAGGAFKNILEGQKVKDIDVFFSNELAWTRAVKKFRKRKYVQAYENARVVAFIDPVSKVRLELIGAETDPEWPDNDLPVQYGTPQETIERFDFTITKFAMYLDGEEWKVVHHVKFFEHLHLRRLVIDADMVKPLSTFERAFRYTGYGYKLCKESKAKLVTAIQETPFEDEAQLSASFYDGID